MTGQLFLSVGPAAQWPRGLCGRGGRAYVVYTGWGGNKDRCGTIFRMNKRIIGKDGEGYGA